MSAALASFAIPCLLLVLLPGPDSLVVLRGLVRGGRRGGTLTALGVLCGVLVWVAAAALGLSALLHASEVGYGVLKLVGACYLTWVGVRSLRSLWQRSEDVTPHEAPSAAPRGGRSAFLSGFLTDLLNPKVGVTFVTFLPGFVPEGHSVAWTSLALGAEFAAFTALYFAVLITASGTISTWMKTPRIRRRLDALTGVVLVGFGVRLATES
jgi:threonine/homoserine/homoserine lactone efflux protein